VQTAEILQLPAPDFRVGLNRTVATVYGPKPFEEMDRDDRVRASYQHCALRWVMTQHMTNQSLRDRFGLPESKASVTSQVIAVQSMRSSSSPMSPLADLESMRAICLFGPDPI
jgi:predicted HTH transcriptional regulator